MHQPKAILELEAAGHDVVHPSQWPKDPGDEEILIVAYAKGRIVVTLDKDFGELAVRHDQPHCGIVRLVGISIRSQAAVCLQILALHGAELEAGAVVTVKPGVVRIRNPKAQE